MRVSGLIRSRMEGEDVLVTVVSSSVLMKLLILAWWQYGSTVYRKKCQGIGSLYCDVDPIAASWYWISGIVKGMRAS